MMNKGKKTKFVISGGNPIIGEHKTYGNKNAALPMIAASMLCDDGEVELTNLPLINDVMVMLELTKELGANVVIDKVNRTVKINPSTINTEVLPVYYCNKVRTSILFAGSLINKLKHLVIPPPGGDVIGRRRLDTHFDGFKKMGITISNGTPYEFTIEKELVGADIILDEASVTATENLVMAAVKAKGRTTLYNAACEPHVVNLCEMLIKMGACIEGYGTNRIVIDGVSKLHGCSVWIKADYIETASFIAAAAATRGKIVIPDVSKDDFLILQRPFKRLGINWTIDENNRLFFDSKDCDYLVKPDFSGAIAKIDDGIWPAIPSDLLSVLIVLATQTNGVTLFFEKMFESRMYFVDNLINMGAGIVQCDPHRVVVNGPQRLNGIQMTSPDIRAGMALVIAGLCANGKTIIGNAESIDRGYESIESSLSALGAEICRIENEEKVYLQ